jgi:hypothetical protein
MSRCLVLACTLAACAPARTPGAPPTIERVPSLAADVAPGACADAVYYDREGTFVAFGDRLYALRERRLLVPTAHQPLPTTRAVAHVDWITAALAGDDAVIALHDEQARSLGRFRVALPARCAAADPSVRWWDGGDVVVSVEVACGQTFACAVTALQMPKDLPPR